LCRIRFADNAERFRGGFKYKTVEKRVVVTPESKRRIEIPAEYKTVEKRVCVTPESKTKYEIPAVFETREHKECDKPERKVWRMTDCVVPMP
jgi:hypothetical protein